MSQSTSSPTVYKGIKTAEGLNLIASEPIAVVVGTGALAKTWHLPKELLIKSSPCFASVLSGALTEPTMKIVHLPETKPDAFALFIRWLYVGKIGGELLRSEAEMSGDELLRGGNDEYATAGMQVYLQAYILGDKLSCPTFQDRAMLELIHQHTMRRINPKTMQIAFEHSAPASKLRRFVIDQFRFDIQESIPCAKAAMYVDAVSVTGVLGLEFVEACREAEGSGAVDPSTQRQRYMEVLTVMEP